MNKKTALAKGGGAGAGRRTRNRNDPWTGDKGVVVRNLYEGLAHTVRELNTTVTIQGRMR